MAMHICMADLSAGQALLQVCTRQGYASNVHPSSCACDRDDYGLLHAVNPGVVGNQQHKQIKQQHNRAAQLMMHGICLSKVRARGQGKGRAPGGHTSYTSGLGEYS